MQDVFPPPRSGGTHWSGGRGASTGSSDLHVPVSILLREEEEDQKKNRGNVFEVESYTSPPLFETRGAQQSTYPVRDVLTADHSCILIQHARGLLILIQHAMQNKIP